MTFQRRLAALGDALRVGRLHAAAGEVPHQLVVRVAAVARRACGRIEGEQALALAVLQHHQLRRVGVALQEGPVDQIGRDQLVQQRHEQGAVGARLDRDPLVGDRRVAGAHRVDRDEATARALELAQRDLHRVAVVVLGGADHHEQPGVVEVGAAELPERAADRVDHPGSHVHRAEAAVRRVVGRAELTREQAGERLHLVAAGEQRELLRVGGSDLLQALGQHLEREVPADRLELAGAAFAALLAQQRLGESRRRDLLHDPRGALRADHALVDRVGGVAVDVAHLRAVLALPKVHADAAAARAHVAGGALDLGMRCRQRRCERVVDRIAGEELEHGPVPGWLEAAIDGSDPSSKEKAENIAHHDR